MDLSEIAKDSEGFSGSDLKEMCRDAALLCVRDFVHNNDERYFFKIGFLIFYSMNKEHEAYW